MTKQELRQKYKLLRSKMTDAEINIKSLDIANNLLQLPIWHHQVFHIFLPIEIQKEVNTEFLLHILQGKDKQIVVSKSDFETREMTHFSLTESTLFRKNDYQISEPTNGLEVPISDISVIFVPLLAYDEAGNRVGYGKGFYDKFLSKCEPDVIKIGLSFFEPEKHINSTTDVDIKLNVCSTPERNIIFN